jgi:hypothetical protein
MRLSYTMGEALSKHSASSLPTWRGRDLSSRRMQDVVRDLEIGQFINSASVQKLQIGWSGARRKVMNIKATPGKKPFYKILYIQKTEMARSLRERSTSLSRMLCVTSNQGQFLSHHRNVAVFKPFIYLGRSNPLHVTLSCRVAVERR